MDIRILGPIAAYAGETALTLGGMRERALLALFALAPGETLSTDRLIDELWGEDLPANPANALQALISRLRRSVGTDLIVTRPPGYVLDVPPDSVDAVRFRSLVEAARYREALELWRGTPLADFPFEEFALRERSALEELHLLAVEGRIAADLEAGAGAELVPELEELIAAHPLRESLRTSQMLALYRAGRQADALRAFAAARDVLGEELGIEPGPELRAMEEAILLQDPELAGPAVPRSRRSSLPARLASFIGREQEMIDVAAAFEASGWRVYRFDRRHEASRLVTLTGAGGAGKTTLAIELGRSLEREYPDGVGLIELAPVVDPALVGNAVVAALDLEQVSRIGAGPADDIDDVQLIVEYLRNRKALLIVDNCEHVVDAAATVVEAILLACPDVEVLATSRDRLGIPGELLWRVPSLDTSSTAIDLFVERARAVNPAFAPDAEELEAINGICRKVDGMPLAIELAAARVRSLPVAEIDRRLQNDIGVLSGGPRSATYRQQTLRGTIDWSYRLLDTQEAELFASLSVFHGSFSLAAVEAVAPPKVDDVLGSLERLIDSSMVAPLAAGRYRMLETLRVYAMEKLGDGVNVAMAGLLDFFTEELAPAQNGLRGPQQIDWLDRIEADLDTIRAVLDWATFNDPDGGLRLASQLGWFWYLRGSIGEARDRFSVLLEAAGSDAEACYRGDAHFFYTLCGSHPELTRVGFEAARDAYLEAGFIPGIVNAEAMIAAFGFELDETIRLLDAAAQKASEVGYEWGVALIRFLQVGVAVNANDVEMAVRLADDATARFAALGDSWGQGYSLYFGGAALRATGEYDKAEAAFREALRHAQPMRLRREMAPVMSELASIATMRGDYDEAERWLVDAQRYADEVPFAGSQGMVINARGKLARLRGDYETARQLHEQAAGLYQVGDAHGGLAYSYSCLGYAVEMMGEPEEAQQHHRVGLEHSRQTGDVFAIAYSLEGLGSALIAAGEARLGVELIWAGLAAREAAGAPLPAGERVDVDRALTAAAAAMDEADLADAAESGRGLGLEAAVEMAAGT